MQLDIKDAHVLNFDKLSQTNQKQCIKLMSSCPKTQSSYMPLRRQYISSFFRVQYIFQ